MSSTNVREAETERYLVDRVARLGGEAYKFISPGKSGVPDRLVVLPGNRIGFLELKAPGQKPRKEQTYRIARLRSRGCLAAWADSRKSVEAFLSVLAGSSPPRNQQEVEKMLETGGLL